MTWQISSASGDPIAAAHARGIIEGRKMQAEEDARIAEDFDWRGMGALDAYHVPQMVAAAILAAAAKIGDTNDQS